ncbi:MAG: DNA recombination/repair protein RecA, partial [Deltaproteobacteria bacterium]|jgi:recombination protein RecA|nr:DNA recombination/repair protein RecA [Deltaproteobacteria bacterium]
VDLGVACDIIEKSGAWFSYGEERIGQGRENAKQFLLDNPDMALDIEAKVLEHYGLTATTSAAEGE